jgi:hypothetical protein
MQDMEQTDSPVAAADDADPRRRRGGANPLSHAVRPFTRTGGFYARSWVTYLDRELSELPVARRTIALATHAFRDEIVLAAFRLQRPLPDAQKVERVNGEVTATLELYGEKGWLEKPEGFFAPPPPLTDVTVRRVNSMGRSYERLSFDSGYEPHPGEPGRDRWLWHRTPIPDLLIAETAVHHGLGVVHVDGDYARIAEVRPLTVRRLG